MFSRVTKYRVPVALRAKIVVRPIDTKSVASVRMVINSDSSGGSTAGVKSNVSTSPSLPRVTSLGPTCPRPAVLYSASVEKPA